MSVTKIYLSPKKVVEVNKDPGRGEDDLQVCLAQTAVGWGRVRACESRPFTTATQQGRHRNFVPTVPTLSAGLIFTSRLLIEQI